MQKKDAKRDQNLDKTLEQQNSNQEKFSADALESLVSRLSSSDKKGPAEANAMMRTMVTYNMKGIMGTYAANGGNIIPHVLGAG